jgi:hypothetical protein
MPWLGETSGIPAYTSPVGHILFESAMPILNPVIISNQDSLGKDEPKETLRILNIR